MGFCGQVRLDGVASLDGAGCAHNPHDTGAPDQLLWLADKERRQQSGQKRINLCTGIAETGDFHFGGLPDAQDRAAWQRQKVNPPRRDVFAKIRRANRKALFGVFIK